MFDQLIEPDAVISRSQETAMKLTHHPKNSPQGDRDACEQAQETAKENAHPDQFANPLIAQISELWKLRQSMVEAQRKLTLQGKAICRRFCDGDKKEADKLYTSITKGTGHAMSDRAMPAILPIIMAQEPLIAQRKAFEKTLSKMGKELPIAFMSDHIKGVNTMTLATIVGELGDLSAYAKGIDGIMKRAGLAVIEGERQRMKSGADAALLHGYSPNRRSVFWNIGGALIKAQGTDGPYRLVYDQRKELELSRGLTKSHAHNRAMRHMTKALLRHLHRAWVCHMARAQ